jgi:hypothetical protein
MVGILDESVVEDGKNRRRCRRAFGRTWAKPLRNKGNFVVWVNEALTPSRRLQIKGGCDFQVSGISG